MTVAQAFEFADKLQYFYSLKQPGSSSINTVLLEYLGKQKYIAFCKAINTRESKLGIEAQYFTEDFIKNPVDTKNILLDNQIGKQWYLSTFMEEIKKLLS